MNWFKWLLDMIGLGWLIKDGGTPSDKPDSSQPAEPPAPQPAPQPVPKRNSLTWIPAGANANPCVQSFGFKERLNVDCSPEVFIVRKSGASFKSDRVDFVWQEDGGWLMNAVWERKLDTLPLAPLVQCFGERFKFSNRELGQTVEAL